MKTESSSGTGFGGVLFLIFLILKLTHYIDWSWWWVTAPLWIPITLAIVLVGFLTFMGTLVNKDSRW